MGALFSYFINGWAGVGVVIGTLINLHNQQDTLQITINM